ncbi:MAG: ABC transporter permease [Anaerolineae bacterium]|jgi:peptide/nickel transport system permease protein|uniref:ABC transporter permease n=1 Tax=Candidatus Flexifilum breve TaxID=3140694 RepID=UPI001ACCEFB0|nr:ABC transporter permease [Chloroflexota bacterium]MBK9745342.1 ABC transporter permease [Chloroflexota bacterium]MBN8634975.1 ABC transporter permease [Anaerolineae bacterium]
MAKYILKRLLYVIPTMIIISVVVFTTIQLPPGDYVTQMIENMRNQTGGTTWSPEFEAAMRDRYGLDEPMVVQYTKWIGNIVLRGDFGYSFQNSEPAEVVIRDRMGMTLIVSISSFVFTWIIALPIGVLSAVKQYSLADYVFSFIGFIGLATPGFLIALVLMFLAFKYGNVSLSGLFSPEFENAPWSFERVIDLFKHMWIPMIIIGVGGTAGLIRVMRANLLDELHKPYVETARAKGLPEWKLLIKYPLRAAMNPFVSSIAWFLPSLIAGEAIVSIVLNLPTIGPVYLNSLLQQDLFVSAGFLMLLSLVTILGTLLSDLMLAWLDPRIQYS